MEIVLYSHFCPEWDYMLIDESDYEILCCTCYEDDQFKNIIRLKCDKMMHECDKIMNNFRKDDLTNKE